MSLPKFWLSAVVCKRAFAKCLKGKSMKFIPRSQPIKYKLQSWFRAFLEPLVLRAVCMPLTDAQNAEMAPIEPSQRHAARQCGPNRRTSNEWVAELPHCNWSNRKHDVSLQYSQVRKQVDSFTRQLLIDNFLGQLRLLFSHMQDRDLFITFFRHPDHDSRRPPVNSPATHFTAQSPPCM